MEVQPGNSGSCDLELEARLLRLAWCPTIWDDQLKNFMIRIIQYSERASVRKSICILKLSLPLYSECSEQSLGCDCL